MTATRDGVWRVIRAAATDTAMAEDALQETFVGVWRGAASYRGDSSARAWIYGLARRQAARTWRRRAGEPIDTTPLDALGAAAGWGRDPEALTSAMEDQATLWRALDRLRPTDREVIVLHDLEGLSGPELGEVLDLTANAARVRLHRARLRLLAALTEAPDA